MDCSFKQIINADMLEIYSNHLIRGSLVLISSLLVSWYAIPIIILIAKKKHLYDVPNGRTSHLVNTPTLGGVSIFASLVVSLGLFVDPEKFPHIQYFLAALTILFFIGLKDDLINISAFKKLFAQVFSAFIIAVLADIRISDFHGFLGIHGLNYYFSVVITIIAIVGFINGFNLIDGIDGLASGIGIVTSLTFGIWFASVNEWEFFILAMGLVGSLIAFFRFNVFSKKRKLFMGDTGSLILGLTVSVLMIHFLELNIPGTAKASVTAAPAIAVAILIVPLFDTLQVMTVRMLKGKSPFKPDKMHLHHVFLELGFTHLKATLFIITANIIIIAFSFVFQSLGIGVLISIFVVFSILSAITLVLLKTRLELKAIEVQVKTNKKVISQDLVQTEKKDKERAKANLKLSEIIKSNPN